MFSRKPAVTHTFAESTDFLHKQYSNTNPSLSQDELEDEEETAVWGVRLLNGGAKNLLHSLGGKSGLMKEEQVGSEKRMKQERSA